MKIHSKYALCIIVTSSLLIWASTSVIALTKSAEIQKVLADLTQLINTTNESPTQIFLLRKLAIAQVKTGQYRDALKTYRRWLEASDNHLQAQVQLLSNMGAAAIHTGEKEWGLKRFHEAIQLLNADDRPRNRVSGYRVILEEQNHLGLSVDEMLKKIRWELANLKVTGEEFDERMSRDAMMLDVLEVELLLKNKVGAEQAINKAFQIINSSPNGQGIYLLRKVAVLQAKLGNHTQALENMKKAFALRKPGERIVYEEGEPAARYITDLCMVAAAQIEIGEKEMAQETFELAQTQMHAFPNDLPSFQHAWRSLAVTAAKLGHADIRKRAEQQIHDNGFKNFSDPEWAKTLVRSGQVEQAIRFATKDRSLAPVLMEELFRKQAFGEIMTIGQASNDCHRISCMKVLGTVIANQKGLAAAYTWVNQQPNSFRKVYGLLGILDWLLTEG